MQTNRLNHAFGLVAGAMIVITTPAMVCANDSETRTETALRPTSAGISGSKGSTDYRIRDDRIDFKVEIEKLPVGAYEFLVNGGLEGTITVVPTPAGNQGELEFSDPVRAGKLPLLFNPDGALFEVAREGMIILTSDASGSGGGGGSGGGSGSGGGGSDDPPGDDNPGSSGGSSGGSGGGTPVSDIPSGGPNAEIETALFPTENGINGSKGEADFRTRPDRVDFKIEIEKLPIGLYEFWVNGARHGNIEVVPTATGNQGELEYANPPRPGKLPLTFNPDGALFEIKSGDSTILAALAPLGDQPGAANGGAVSFPKQKVKQPLSSLDGSRGRAVVSVVSSRSKARLIVNFTRLDPGAYTFCSNGIPIQDFVYERGKHRITLSSIPGANERLLNFDPTNSGYELMRDGVIVMSGTVGGTPLGNGVLPLGEIERSFSNTGLDGDAVGRARLRTRADRTDFNVEVEDLPAGQYRLIVDGLDTGGITVVTTETGTQGEAEFQSPTDDADKNLLTFDPRGRTIQITGTGGTVYLSLIF